MTSPSAAISVFDVEETIVSRGHILPPAMIHKCEIVHSLMGEGSTLRVRSTSHAPLTSFPAPPAKHGQKPRFRSVPCVKLCRQGVLCIAESPLVQHSIISNFACSANAGMWCLFISNVLPTASHELQLVLRFASRKAFGLHCWPLAHELC